MTTSLSAATLISSGTDLEVFISSIPKSSTLYLDLEGHCLGRHGTISLMTILLHPQGLARIIDVLSLGKAAFSTVSKDGKSLKSILEDSAVPKCLWDVRNDADALWASYQVDLSGVVDIQLLENASRNGDKKYLCGLEKAIKNDLTLEPTLRNRWISSKQDIKGLMLTNIFAARPVEEKTVQYCVNDVIHLPDLHTTYLGRISGPWLAKAKEETLRRLSDARSVAYNPQSDMKALGPWGSGIGGRILSMDELLEVLDDERVEDLSRDMFGDDDDDYYFDDGPTSCRDIISDWDYDYYYSD
ncbi:hypothetical protein PG993_010707 [Apiospora rasikravindrae]|uniref:3'-5' exonuclease domain-containing protein n=1 Tax=Apiospora rasikravindrae TaxID=990691 RepID=A0ABR1SCF6_9PEZI